MKHSFNPVSYREPLKILILEDNEDDAYVLKYRLQKYFDNCECIVSDDEAHFKTTLGTFRPQVVLADNSLMNFDATDALKEVRRTCKNTVFIMVTGMLSEEIAFDIIREGGDDFIVKDRLSKISTVVDAALIRRQKFEEQKETAAGVLHRHAKDTEILCGISEGVISVSKAGTINFINDAAKRLLGQKAPAAIGKKLLDTFPELTSDDYIRLVSDRVSSNDTIPQTRFLPATDTWIECRYSVAKNGLLIYLKDVTGEIRNAELVRETEQRYQHYFDRMSEAFVSIDQNWCYTYLNLQARKWLKPGVSLIGQRIWDAFPETVGTPTYDAFQLAMKEQRYVVNTDYYPPADCWHENHIYPSADGLSIFIRDITAQKKMEMKLEEQKRKAEMETIAASLAAEEKERNAIGKELHDNVNQILASTNLFLTLIRETPERAAELVPFCIDTVKKAINENRRLAHELVTPDLSSQTLAGEVRYLFDTMFIPLDIHTTIHLNGFNEKLLTAEQKLALYRILQEQCANIIKHASATSVEFSLAWHDDTAVIILKDNGRGADLSAVKRGIGLKNIASRVKLMGGELQVVSFPGKGFSLEVRVPAKMLLS